MIDLIDFRRERAGIIPTNVELLTDVKWPCGIPLDFISVLVRRNGIIADSVKSGKPVFEKFAGYRQIAM